LRLPLSLDLDLTTPLPDFATLRIPPTEGSNRRDVEMAQRRLDAAELAVDQAKDARRPSLNVGAYATQTFSGRFIDEAGRTTNRDYGFNLALNLPLLNYDAGRNSNSVKTSRLFAEQAQADLETTKLTAELGVNQARAALARATKRLQQLPDPASAAKALAAATRALFSVPREGAPALLAQVSNARSSWRAAQAAVIDARTGALIAALRLAKAMGQPMVLSDARHEPRS
jgi:outer membrane protein TolC